MFEKISKIFLMAVKSTAKKQTNKRTSDLGCQHIMIYLVSFITHRFIQLPCQLAHLNVCLMKQEATGSIF